jgi:hypothetical protein
MRLLIIFTLLITTAYTVEAKIYQCKVNGKTTIQQFQCPAQSKAEILNVKENDYSSQQWKAVDATIARQKYQDALIYQARRDAFEKQKQADIARVERSNTERFRRYTSARSAYDEQQAAIRHTQKMNNMQTLANLRYRR